ncbi:MAG TPA: hypothetical protein VKY37_02325 [Brumimicrobium sp.]|nr:hypothetical protein [Brumimicrobium sp.]
MQDTTNNKPTVVEKELIPQLKFVKETKVKQQEGLMEKLMEATKLGNIHHGKVVIVFEDDEGLKQVETTIWATGLKYICLKGGVWLPIAKIHKIVFI